MKKEKGKKEALELIFLAHLDLIQVQGAYWSLSQLSLGERQPWTGGQSTTGPHRDERPRTLRLTPVGNNPDPDYPEDMSG